MYIVFLQLNKIIIIIMSQYKTDKTKESKEREQRIGF